MDEELLLFDVINTTFWKRKITEKEISQTGTSWAYFDKNTLKPKENTLAIISVKHEP